MIAPPSVQVRWLIAPGLVLAAVAAAWATADPVPSAEKTVTAAPAKKASVPSAPVDASPAKPPTRMREGTSLVDEPGEFHDAGERLVFQCRQRNATFTTLENLSLERVWAVLGDTTGPRQWIVSGTITEFRGTNYLLITRAVLRSKAADHAPAPPPAQP